MLSTSNPDLNRLRLFRPLFSSAAVAASLVIWACLDDGPNRTGLGYLSGDGGVVLTTPLYHLRFDHFPIDSAVGVEIPLSHLGESLLVVGREGPYRATPRLGFQITTQPQRDSIAKKGLKLRLGALSSKITGYKFLKTSVAGHDSLTLLIESFAWQDTSGLRFADSLAVFHRRILTNPVSFSTLDTSFRVRDTIRIGLHNAYHDIDSLRDSLQTRVLPNLRSRMLARMQTGIPTDSTRNWLVYLEVSPLSGSPDSGMFRFDGGSFAGSHTALLLGDSSSLALPPYPTYSTLGYYPATNYQVFHSGSRPSLLYGVSRGLHLRLDRKTLMDSIATRMGNPALADSTPGKYDTRFFLPYAEIRFPLDSARTKVDGPFALDMQITSDVDSAAVPGALLSDTLQLPLDSTLRLLYSYGIADAQHLNPTDSLYCKYQRHPADSALRQAIFRWKGIDSAISDTFTLIPDGRSWELGLKRISSSSRTHSVSVVPDSGHLSLKVFFSTSAVTEPNGFLDSTLKADLTAYADLKRRYIRPGASELALRATRGIRSLLNRNTGAVCTPTPCPDVAPDLFLRPFDRRAFDATDSANYLQVPYPVLGEIEFPRNAGKLEVTLDLYLYPLRSAP